MQRKCGCSSGCRSRNGHAVQHAVGYSMLQLRSKLVPVGKYQFYAFSVCDFCRISVMIASRSIQNPQGNTTVLAIGVLLFCSNYTLLRSSLTSRV